MRLITTILALLLASSGAWAGRVRSGTPLDKGSGWLTMNSG